MLIICEVERTKLLIIIKNIEQILFVWLYKHILNDSRKSIEFFFISLIEKNIDYYQIIK